MRIRRDYQKERQVTANVVDHTASIFVRALERIGCVVEKDMFAYQVTCPHGFRFSLTVVKVGRRGGMMMKVFRKGKEHIFGEKPFFSWVNHNEDHISGQITPKRASVLLVKKIRMNPLYDVMET